MRKLEINYNKILDRLAEIEPTIFIDFLVSIYSEHAIEADFKEFVSQFNFKMHENAKIITIITDILHYKKPKYIDMFKKIIKRNDNYITSNDCLNWGIEKLEEEMRSDIVPGMHGKGLAPEMVILYFYSKNIMKNEMIDLAIKVYKDNLEKESHSVKEKLPQKVEFEENLKGSRAEDELNEFIYEKHLKNFFLDWKILEKNYQCAYNEATKSFDGVKRGIILFLHTKFAMLLEEKKYTQNLLSVLSKNIAIVNRFGEKQATFLNEYYLLKKESKEFNRKFKIMKKEISSLNDLAKSNSKNINVDAAEIEKIKRENYYLKTRIEKLEEYISELEEEKKINEGLTENIHVEQNIIEFRKELPEYQNIVIVGGNWNSKSKEDVANFLTGNDITFINADRTLRSVDKIKNSDIVIFDTSYNAHAYFYKVKDIASKLFLINKSNVSSIKEIFE